MESLIYKLGGDGNVEDMTPVEWVIIVSAGLLALCIVFVVPIIVCVRCCRKKKKVGNQYENTSLDMSQNQGIIQLQEMSEADMEESTFPKIKRYDRSKLGKDYNMDISYANPF